MTHVKAYNFRNLAGQQFGYVTALSIHGKDTQGGFTWLCICKCGKECVRSSKNLLKRRVSSCGCASFRKRGGKRDYKSYHVWRSMLQRCRQKDPRYGGRGIKVCKRWLKFENFLKDMGERPAGMTIERKDNDGDYEPSNCKWATQAEQTRNCSRNVKITMNGKTQCVADWATELKIPAKRVYSRLKLGWGIQHALLTPASLTHPRKGVLINRQLPL